MAAVPIPASMTIEEYLETFFEPECEYWDGLLIQKPLGTKDHARLQARIAYFLMRFEDAGLCQVTVEQSLRINERTVLIPDVCVLPANNDEHGVVSQPALICIEVLSPSDRFSYTLKKCRVYLQQGVLACWILDPVDKEAWYYDDTGLHQVDSGMLRCGAIELSLAEVWPETPA